jgi:hypothetical protein
MDSGARASSSKLKVKQTKEAKAEKHKRHKKKANGKNGNSGVKIKAELPDKMSIPELTGWQQEVLYSKYVYSSASEPELPEDKWKDNDDREYEVEKVVDEIVDMTGKHKWVSDYFLSYYLFELYSDPV